MTIKERMVCFVEKFGKKKADLVAELGVAASNFRGASLQNGINSDTIENFLTLYPKCSAEWLLRGQGDMLRSENALSVSADNAGRDAMVTGVNYGTVTKGERTTTKCDDCALLNAKDEIIRTKDELIRAKQDTIDAQNVIILSLKQGL